MFLFSNFLRFLGLLGYRHRYGADTGFQVEPQLQPPFPFRLHGRVLEALAYFFVHLDARLCLLPALREAPRDAAHLRQHHGGFPGQRTLAWCAMELYGFGPSAWLLSRY